MKFSFLISTCMILHVLGSYSATAATTSAATTAASEYLRWDPFVRAADNSKVPNQTQLQQMQLQQILHTESVAVDVNLQDASSCSGGTYWTGSICAACPSNQFSFAGRTSCLSTCPAGSKISGQACLYCPIGNYQTLSGQRSCNPCAVGTYAGAAGATSCTPCADGYVSDRAASSCTACDIGYKSNYARSVCDPCPAGQSSSQGSKVCTTCSDGYASNGGGPCYGCSKGEYQTVNHETCARCPVGKFVGTALSNSIDDCQSCLAGTYTTGEGASACTKCDYGTFLPTEGGTSQGQCQLCSTGSYAHLQGQSRCTMCVAGKFNDDTGSVSEAFCRACESGKFSYAGASTCTSCPKGTFTAVTQTTQDACHSCPPGTYNDNEGSNSCRPCPSGSVSTVVGATSENVCKVCEAGKYSNPAGTICEPCPLGTISKYPGASSISMCSSCRSGSYSDEIGARECKMCLAGTASPVERATSQAACRPCSSGTYGSIPGLSTCPPCSAGLFSVAGSYSCMSCSSGFLSSTGSGTCDHESDHPYTEITDDVDGSSPHVHDSPVFILPGYTKYELIVDSRTDIQTSSDFSNPLDNLYVRDGADRDIILYKYQSSDTYDNGVSTEYIKLIIAPNGLVISFETDGYVTDGLFGYKISIRPVVNEYPTFAPTLGLTIKPLSEVKLNFHLEVSGVDSDAWSTNSQLKTDLLTVLENTIAWKSPVSIVFVSAATTSGRRQLLQGPTIAAHENEEEDTMIATTTVINLHEITLNSNNSNDQWPSRLQLLIYDHLKDQIESYARTAATSASSASASAGGSIVNVEITTTSDYTTAEILVDISNAINDRSLPIQLAGASSFKQFAPINICCASFTSSNSEGENKNDNGSGSGDGNDILDSVPSMNQPVKVALAVVIAVIGAWILISVYYYICCSGQRQPWFTIQHVFSDCCSSNTFNICNNCCTSRKGSQTCNNDVI